MNGAVVVFARTPEFGYVKTRLQPALGPQRTLLLYRAFLADSLEAARASGARVLLAYTNERPQEAELADDAFPQRGETFGARFDAALEDARARVAGPLVLVGADTPHLGPDALAGALAMLERHDSVLGPSTEGGFYLLGFRGSVTSIAKAFDEPNDSAAVALLTRAVLLPRFFDIDVPQDLVELLLHVETASASSAWVPPRTIAALAQMGARVETARTMGARGRALVVGP